jgi:CDP-glycerol glycerophosphotransferase (TagB/SpsB family)
MPKVDMLISAYSSTIEEFLYFNKPIIIADPGIKPVENSNPQKVWNVCTVCKNTAKLKEIVDEQFKNDNLGEKRKAYFKNLVYNEKETTAIERGIKAIREVIRK